MRFLKSAIVALAAGALLLSASFTEPSQALGLRSLLKGGAVAGAGVAVVVEVEAASAVGLALSEGAAATGVARIAAVLAKHRILGPGMVYHALARKVVEYPQLHTMALNVIRIVGLDEGRLLMAEEKIVAKQTAEDGEGVQHDYDECYDWLDNEGKPHPREWLDRLAEANPGATVTSSTIAPVTNRTANNIASGYSANGVPFDIRGWPIFKNWTVVDFIVKDANFTAAGYKRQMAMATRQLREELRSGARSAREFTKEQLEAIEAGDAAIPRYTWHHHQDPNRMQLVDRDIHRKAAHDGGWCVHGEGGGASSDNPRDRVPTTQRPNVNPGRQAGTP